MNKILSVLIAVPFILTSINCGTPVGERPGEDESIRGKESVEVTEAQMNAADIKLGVFEKKNLRTSVKANGILELPPQNKATISAILGGTIKEILITEGEFVKEGQTLALLENPEFIEVQQEYLESLSRYELLEKEYERKKKLYTESISSGKEFQETEAEYHSTISKLSSLKAKLDLLNLPEEEVSTGKIFTSIPVKAPIQGYIRNIQVNIGMYSEPQKNMFEIVDNHHIHIDLLVYETDINKIKKGQKVLFQVSNIGDKELEAKIFAVGKSFEDELKAVRIHAEIQNQDNDLIPGMYVDGRIIVDDYETYTLPESAIIREGESAYIFVKSSIAHKDEEEHKEDRENQNEGEHISFRKIQVKTGVSDRGYTEILSFEGMNENLEVVVYGAYYLDSEMTKGEGEHHH